MAPRKPPSISLPIVLSSVSVALGLAVLIGWVYVFLRSSNVARQVTQNIWLLVGGIASLATIITVLVLFSVFLARQILEVRRQTSFLDSVTHELRSPLASLRLCVETLARPELTEAQQADLRRMMLDDLERLSSFIDDILQASRLSHGGRTLQRQPVDLVSLLEGCAEAVQRRYRGEASELSLQFPAELRVQADRGAIELAVKNLLDNAYKYSEPPRRIVVRAERRPDRWVSIEVKDSGVGIDKRDLKRIFERFYRAPEESVRRRRGSGLGLFVAAALVHGMGGRLRASSAGRGAGASFRMLLRDHDG